MCMELYVEIYDTRSNIIVLSLYFRLVMFCSRNTNTTLFCITVTEIKKLALKLGFTMLQCAEDSKAKCNTVLVT